MKKFLNILLVIFLIELSFLLIFLIFNRTVDISEFSFNKDYYIKTEIDLNKTGKQDIIELIRKDEIKKDITRFKEIFQDYKLIINNKEFEIEKQENNHIISLGIADLNGDSKKEILICTSNLMVSPSYKQWLIYSYNKESLKYIGKIYDGNISYNRLTNKLLVIYQLHETRYPMYKFLTYNLNYIKEGFPKE